MTMKGMTDSVKNIRLTTQSIPFPGTVGRLLGLWVMGMIWLPLVASGEPGGVPDAPEEEAFTLATPSPENVEEDADAQPSWHSLTNNLRLGLEMVSRVWTTQRRGKPSAFNTIGVDVHKVFTDDKGDIGTLLLQLHFARRDNAFPAPHHVEDDDDWEFEVHEAYFNITRWGRGRTNIRIGRITVPFGLEMTSETHLTLYQTISHENLGLKRDYGFSLNGSLPKFDYEIALTQASGHEYWNVGKNYAVAGRIGTPSDQNFVLGIAAFHGQVRNEHGIHRWRSGLPSPTRVDRVLGRTPGGGKGDDDLVRRTRVGVDATWVVGQVTLKGEMSAGRDFDQDVFNTLLEVDWDSADETVHAYLQGIYMGQRSKGWDEDITTRIGVVWHVTSHFELSGQYSQDLKTYGDRRTDALYAIQARMRF